VFDPKIHRPERIPNSPLVVEIDFDPPGVKVVQLERESFGTPHYLDCRDIWSAWLATLRHISILAL
jgi:hypothetical protein